MTGNLFSATTATGKQISGNSVGTSEVTKMLQIEDDGATPRKKREINDLFEEIRRKINLMVEERSELKLEIRHMQMISKVRIKKDESKRKTIQVSQATMMALLLKGQQSANDLIEQSS